LAIVVGAALVYFLFPRAEEEKRLLAGYHATDMATVDETVGAPSGQRERLVAS